MRYHIISIFPEVFESFVTTSLLAKWREKGLIDFVFVNPRDFCQDRQRQVDDQIYGWGAGLLMKAQPIIDAIKSVMRTVDPVSCAVIMPEPSEHVFCQQDAHEWTEKYTDIVFVCGRYEWIDHRVEMRCGQVFGQDFYKVSLGQFVTLGGEVPVMLMIETLSRLLPGVINDELSRKDESYRPEKWGKNIEYPHYTRPEEVEWMRVPEVLLSGHHKKIEEWRGTSGKK